MDREEDSSIYSALVSSSAILQSKYVQYCSVCSYVSARLSKFSAWLDPKFAWSIEAPQA